MAEDPKRRGAWGLIEDAIAEHEVERAGELSGDELVAAMKKAGLDPARARALTDTTLAAAASTPAATPAAAPRKRNGAWRLIESAIAEHEADEAAKQAAGNVVSLDERRKEQAAPQPGGAWPLIEDAIAEEDVERVGKLSGDALAAEMKKAGLDPSRARALTDKVLAATRASADPPKVVRLDERRRRRWMGPSLLVAAASAALYVAAVGTGTGVVGTGDPYTPQEAQAHDLRKEAFAACEKGDAPLCKAKLDQAKELDPKGEQKNDVAQARARIEELERR
jgi:hypothetical protein